MKYLSNEELLAELCSENNKYVVGIEETPEYKEALSRLSTGEEAVKKVAELENDKRELVEVLEAIRKVVVVACGDKAPYIKIALERLDAALAKHKEAL